ncbi:hypothetical protein E1301_Tti019199 [Triplophysa tibetana]|uniref:Uncharacterized protein n=1 Tax=Triplophysa tibetana TaxID=1572043 RepID=A0A5A9P9D3_9TELE|nr:hypothetical protein E1301_Tti019199 [Triplophysa tibetana]
MDASPRRAATTARGGAVNLLSLFIMCAGVFLSGFFRVTLDVMCTLTVEMDDILVLIQNVVVNYNIFKASAIAEIRRPQTCAVSAGSKTRRAPARSVTTEGPSRREPVLCVSNLNMIRTPAMSDTDMFSQFEEDKDVFCILLAAMDVLDVYNKCKSIDEASGTSVITQQNSRVHF